MPGKWNHRGFPKYTITPEQFERLKNLLQYPRYTKEELGVLHEEKLVKERGPNGEKANTPGAKLDLGKSPIFRGCMSYFPRAVSAVASVSEYGATKYVWKGWETVPDGIQRYTDAIGRHLIKEEIEGPYDLDALNDEKFPGQLLHKAQVAWNALAALELYLREQEKKDAT